MDENLMLAQSSAWLRVQRGAQWLDAKIPGWEAKIDLSSFDISDGCNCLLGQLCAVVTGTEVGVADGFYQFVCGGGVDCNGSIVKMPEPVSYGFDGDEGYIDSDSKDPLGEMYAELQNEWLKELAARGYSQ